MQGPLSWGEWSFPPGLEGRPRSWPVRRQRQHFAAATNTAAKIDGALIGVKDAAVEQRGMLIGLPSNVDCTNTRIQIILYIYIYHSLYIYISSLYIYGL